MNEFQSLADLLELQAVDLQIDRLLHQRQTLPELDLYRVAHARAVDIDARRANVDAELKQIVLQEDKAEGELGLLEQRLHQHEQRLYAGGLSARETENMRRDVESLRSRESVMEDEVIVLLDRKETLEAEVARLSGELEEAQGEEQRLEGLIASAWKTIDGKIAGNEARKLDIVPLIPAELLELYEHLREAKEGVAVGRLEDGGICGGCHLRLSAAEQSQALAEDPPKCLHCRRILVP